MATVDARGKKCPIPLVMAKLAFETLGDDEVLVVLATDPEAPIDLAAWAGDAGLSFEEKAQGQYELRRQGYVEEG